VISTVYHPYRTMDICRLLFSRLNFTIHELHFTLPAVAGKLLLVVRTVIVLIMAYYQTLAGWAIGHEPARSQIRYSSGLLARRSCQDAEKKITVEGSTYLLSILDFSIV
jgi:hypothetical protein